MLMTGHFFFLQSDLPLNQQEPVFIARCEQILSSTPNIPSNSLGVTSANTLRLLLNEQMHVSEISTKYVSRCVEERCLTTMMFF